jgi:hypothetical protein
LANNGAVNQLECLRFSGIGSLRFHQPSELRQVVVAGKIADKSEGFDIGPAMKMGSITSPFLSLCC